MISAIGNNNNQLSPLKAIPLYRTSKSNTSYFIAKAKSFASTGIITMQAMGIAKHKFVKHSQTSTKVVGYGKMQIYLKVYGIREKEYDIDI
jgi:hypothetical protein